MFTRILKKVLSLSLIFSFSFGLAYYLNLNEIKASADSTSFPGGNISLQTQFSTNGTDFSDTIQAGSNQEIYVRQYYDNTSSSTVSNTSITNTLPNGYSFVPGSASNTFTAGDILNTSPSPTNEVLRIFSDTTNGSTTFTDIGGDGLPLTVVQYNAVDHSTDNPYLGSTSIDFSGGDLFVDAESVDWSNDFTIEFWVNPDNSNDQTYVFADTISDDPNIFSYSWSIDRNSNGNLALTQEWFGDQTSGSYILTYPHTLSNDTWQHIAFTRNGANFKMFVDGTEIAPPSLTNVEGWHFTPGIAFTLTFGYGFFNDYDPFDGQMQDIRVHKSSIYDANFVPPGIPGGSAVLSDSIFSGQNLTVSPSSGLNGNSNNATSGDLIANSAGYIEYRVITPSSNVAQTFSSTMTNTGSSFTVSDIESITQGSGSGCTPGNDGQTCLSLDIIAGDLSITSPETETLSGVTLSSNDVDSTATISGINITDTRGSKTGWTASVSFQNLVSVNNPDTNNNILMANSLDNIISSNSSYLSINNTNHSAAANSSSLDGINRPLSPSFNTLTSLDNNGATGAITILSAPINQGAGSYSLDMNLTLTLPAFGTYGDSPELQEKRIDGGDYRGNVLFTVI
jgi:hypothetical protein